MHLAGLVHSGALSTTATISAAPHSATPTAMSPIPGRAVLIRRCGIAAIEPGRVDPNGYGTRSIGSSRITKSSSSVASRMWV